MDANIHADTDTVYSEMKWAQHPSRVELWNTLCCWATAAAAAAAADCWSAATETWNLHRGFIQLKLNIRMIQYESVI